MKEPVYVKQGNFPSTRGIEENNLMVREALFLNPKTSPIPTLESQMGLQQEILQPTERAVPGMRYMVVIDFYPDRD